MQIRSILNYYPVRWIVLCSLIGLFAGVSSALFLVSLDWVTHFRESHLWLVLLLPFGGLMVGWIYYKWGKGAEGGNNLIIDSIHEPKEIIPLKMSPLILLTTLITHLYGGSAGREGTAIQMSGSLSDQITNWFKLTAENRQVLLMASISAGFAAVFGTPWAGVVFGMEVVFLKKMRYDAILPCIGTAFIADFATAQLCGVEHTSYSVGSIAYNNYSYYIYALPAGIAFGLAAFLFIKLAHYFSTLSRNIISFAPIRPFIGGIVLLFIFAGFYFFDNNNVRYLGLGIPVIVDSFTSVSSNQDFILKILLSAFTLGFGFKGGEVTPLFFIGATLGSALSGIIPIPLGLLAGMGFVAVFSGASKTPFACMIMGIELFGWETGIFMALVCVVAFYTSGNSSIYASQEKNGGKHLLKY